MSAGKPAYVASFDSATAMVQSLARVLRGQDFPMLGGPPPWAAPAMKALAATVNALPKGAREWVYIVSGATEALPARRLGEAKTDRIAQWLADLYPRRRYPAVMLGSSNGALVHLCALFGIPWLPQTALVPVRRSGVHPDEPQQDFAWSRAPARVFLDANPDVQLHHMCDPNQDRLMLQKMSYFRFKRLRLGAAYERFLEQALAPGGTLFIVDCALRWPTTRLGERHVFQFGALGGLEPEEYLRGSERVEDYLTRYRFHRSRWDPPAPNGETPEAEWGLEPALVADIERFARRRGHRMRRITFAKPEDMSPLVADLYAWCNRGRGIAERRLLAESFIVMEPYWTMRTGSIPFWSVFNMEPSAAALEAYLDARPGFDEIGVMLFSHGVESAGLAPVGRWRDLAARARQGVLVGVDEKAYPRDFAVFVRYSYDLRRKFRARYPIPPPLALGDLDRFLNEHKGRHAVRWD
jgi:hypothetical protein